jgi:hypothetical protein
MPFIQAGTYTLISRRFPSALRNIIRVTPLPFVGAGNGIEFVELTYNITPTTPPTVGSIASTTPPRVFAFLPEEDFEIHRIVFQTEAPIEIEWETNPAIPSQLSSIEVRTRPEPPGEGPTDKSYWVTRRVAQPILRSARGGSPCPGSAWQRTSSVPRGH